MFAGMLLTGFGGKWITQGSCVKRESPHATARCHRCQCGICENHGILLSRASREGGASMACCVAAIGCEDRQKDIFEFWKKQTGEELE